MTAPLIDARQAGELLGVPHTWLLRQARTDQVPHIRLGHYVRFDGEQLLAWARARARGPRYPHASANSGPGADGAARGPTPSP
jgi:hypothetical protein